MAEPLLTASLLTPVSIRLAWTYSGSADFEVFWKSDHPAGQEYVLLARTTAKTYDVGSLSWTTTYYFKVRAVSGATYGAFGNEMSIFVCCGAAFAIEGPPNTVGPPASWQQSIDIQDGKVVITIPYVSIQQVRYYLVEADGGWNLVRYVETNEDLVAYPYDVIMMNVNNDTFVYITFPLQHTPILWSVLYGEKYVTSWESWGTYPYLCKNISVNSTGRVVVLLQDQTLGWESTLNLATSRDFGRSFESPIMISDNGGNGWDQGAYMAEDSDGALWFLVFDSVTTAVTIAAIYKYTEGGTFDLIRTIPGDHANGGDFSYNSLDIDGDIIVATYMDFLAYVYTPYIEISIDGGATWNHRQIDLVTPSGYPPYSGPTRISDGNLITFGYNSTGNHYCLIRSTDYGETWVEVVNLSTYQIPYPEYSFLRADGLDLVFTSCAFTDVVGGSIGYLRSSDAGATWAYVDASGTIWGPIPNG
jgi:hypothetical protein